MAVFFKHRLHERLAVCLTLILVGSWAGAAYSDDCRKVQNILVLFDASGYMKEQDRYTRLLEQMRFFQRAIPLTADGLFNVGLRHYGLKVGMGCENTELVLAVQPWDPEKFINAFPRTVSYGVSSLSAGLRAAAGDLTGDTAGKSIIVVVGGGVESCNVDPIKIADQICRNNPNIEIHTFQVGRTQDGQFYLSGIAQKGHGDYTNANEINNPAPWHAWMRRHVVEPCGPSEGPSTGPAPPAAQAVNPVTFDFKSFSVRSSEPAADGNNRAALEAVAQIMKQDPAVKVVLHGFSDGRGNPNYNMELSRKRAQAVAQYLITSYGIHQSRISVVGHGSTQSVLQPSGAVPDRMGRRVEFEVTR